MIMKNKTTLLIIAISLLPIHAHTETVTVWKVANKSAYSDAPPQLRLQNVQIFNPRTKKLSKVINTKPTLRERTPKPIETETIEIDTTQITQDIIQIPKKEITSAEQERRNQCQQAQDRLNQAIANQDPNAHTYEADVVQHCIAA